MIASPSSTEIYDEVPPVKSRTTSTNRQTASSPLDRSLSKRSKAQNGAEIRILYGNQLTGKKLNLTYANITDARGLPLSCSTT